MSYQSRNFSGRQNFGQGARQGAGQGTRQGTRQSTNLYDIQIPSSGLNVRVNLSNNQLDGICLGRYLIFGDQGTNEVRIFAVAGMRQNVCNQTHIQNHILLQDEDAFEFDIENAGPEFTGQKLAKVDLETGVYIINYENEQVLQGISQVFTWAGLNPAEYLFPY